jgi:hypothetical protein
MEAKASSGTQLYLLLVIIVTAFRVFMYVFFKEYVTQVKITKAAWEQDGYREVMHAHTTMILLFMTYRLFTVIIAYQMEDSYGKDALCQMNLLADYILFLVSTGVHHKLTGTKQRIVLIHRLKWKPPVVLQFLLIVGGTYFVYLF